MCLRVSLYQSLPSSRDVEKAHMNAFVNWKRLNGLPIAHRYSSLERIHILLHMLIEVAVLAFLPLSA